MGTYSNLLKQSKPTSPQTDEKQDAESQVVFAQQSQKLPSDQETLSKEASFVDTVIPQRRDTTTPRHHGITQVVRKAVKELGKEAATHRFTVKEKQAVAEIVFLYKRRGIKTSENEITRIALNLAVEAFKREGEESSLAKVLAQLNE